MYPQHAAMQEKVMRYVIFLDSLSFYTASIKSRPMMAVVIIAVPRKKMIQQVHVVVALEEAVEL
jgi:hypothetical protein